MTPAASAFGPHTMAPFQTFPRAVLWLMHGSGCRTLLDVHFHWPSCLLPGLCAS
jgi:hypothetical protein